MVLSTLFVLVFTVLEYPSTQVDEATILPLPGSSLTQPQVVDKGLTAGLPYYDQGCPKQKRSEGENQEGSPFVLTQHPSSPIIAAKRSLAASRATAADISTTAATAGGHRKLST